MDANAWIPTPIGNRSRGRWPGVGDPHDVLWQSRSGNMFNALRDYYESEIHRRLDTKNELVAWRPKPQPWVSAPDYAHDQECEQVIRIGSMLYQAIVNAKHNDPESCRRACGDIAIYINNLITLRTRK
jgi:hypothetical protein